MKSLYGFLKSTYEKGIIQDLGFTDEIAKSNNNLQLDFEDLINDNNWCLELIRTNLDFKSNNLKLDKSYAYRYKHIVICWLLGVGLSELIAPDLKNDMIFHRTWQLSAYTHDYGYFCDEVFIDPSEDFLKSFGDYYLLKDNYSSKTLQCLNGFLAKNPSLLSCSYNEIENYYYDDIKRRRERQDLEKSDHGIVGACIAFREYIQYLEKRALLTNGIKLEDGIRIKEINKTACLITASHNLWGKQIKKDCRLLLLMGLVDTIEATKCFNALDKNGQSYQMIKCQKLLDLIQIDIGDGLIEINIDPLQKYIFSKSTNLDQLKMRLKHYCNSLLSLNEWTCFQINQIENSFKISL